MLRALPVSILFLLLAAASLVPKFTSHISIVQPSETRLHADLGALLRAAGFAVKLVDRRYFLDHVVATRGNCRIAVTHAVAGGANSVRFGELNAQWGTLRFYYDGGWHGGIARIRPVIDRYVQRYAWQLGYNYTHKPVLMLVASNACDIDTVDWAMVRVHPQMVKRSLAQ